MTIPTQQIDWSKCGLLLLLVMGIAIAWNRNVNVLSLNIPPFTAGQLIEVPAPSDSDKKSVASLVAIKTDNPGAAKVIADFLSAYAFILEHSDPQHLYTTEMLSQNIQVGLEHLFALSDETGTLTGFGASLDQSLDSLWGDRNTSVTKRRAATAIYACAWALS